MADEAGYACTTATAVDGYTAVAKGAGASVAGSVTKLKCGKRSSAASSTIAFAFFTASGNNLTLVSGSRVTGLSLDTNLQCGEFEAGVDFTSFSVSLGDFVGTYGSLQISYTTASGEMWYAAGDHTDASNYAFTANDGWHPSVSADITEGGGRTTKNTRPTRLGVESGITFGAIQ